MHIPKTRKEFRRIVIREAMAYNRHLTESFLMAKSTRAIIAYTHPYYRRDHLFFLDHLKLG